MAAAAARLGMAKAESAKAYIINVEERNQ